MRIAGIPAAPAAVNQARSSARREAAAPVEGGPVRIPATAAETPEADAPVETGRAHGLVRAAEHSHRSDVAALRQWINHPERRDNLALPDLSAEHKGNGFAQAVAAYEAVIAMAEPPPATDPVTTDPVVTDPVVTDPLVTDPVVTTDPAPATLLPAGEEGDHGGAEGPVAG